MAQFDQMYTHALDALKGWPSPHGLDFAALPASGVTVVPGMCCSLDSTGKLILGVVRCRMPLFAIQGAGSFDVGAGATIAGYGAINPSGKINCLVGTGSYELSTTEFDTSLTYVNNEPLRAHTDGKLTNASVVPASQTDSPQTSSTAVVGIVSRGKYTNSYGVSVLAFWTYFLPGRSAE